MTSATEPAFQLTDYIDPAITNPYLEGIDKAHRDMGFFNENDPLILEIWKDKYAWKTDRNIYDTFARVANGVFALDTGDRVKYATEAYHAMEAGLWMPAGRILAGAGTPKRVTLINCYVNATIEDAMESIMQTVSYAALTMQQGGGVGTDFSPIRPENALLRRTHTKASGPIPFMKMWDGMSKTIRSAGDRRGAMMGTLSDTHPDLPKFIKAKTEAGVLTQFNVSVLISDAFMAAVEDDEEWTLHFNVPPIEREAWLEAHDFDDPNTGERQYVYSVWRARDLWNMILETTYEYAEPGIIFIDRVNDLNNLQHVERIRCTNPCGEQPLPPHGACDLGAINLARLVINPFTKSARINWELLKRVTHIGMRFLDNVLDVTNYPLPEQAAESRNKRRTGIGISGLADLLMQMGVRYGTTQAKLLAEEIQRFITLEAYIASINLAIEKGPCPAFDICMTEGTTFIAQRLPAELKALINKHGLRNGVIGTIAPTGTTSIVFGNISGSGCEPAFAHSVTRKVLQADGVTTKPYTSWGYTARLYKYLFGEEADLPAYCVTAQDLTVEDHIVMQSALQFWVDASISKTVNCPPDMTFEDFVKVYEMAYAMGCKGCTTYRPSGVRGSVLEVAGEATSPAVPEKPKRPKAVKGTTYQIKWPSRDAAFYLVINEKEGAPFELFITSKDSTNVEWVTALTLMITAIFRNGGDVSFVAKELKQIQSVHDTAWIDGKFFGSLPAYIGHILEEHFASMKEPVVLTFAPEQVATGTIEATKIALPESKSLKAEACPKCHTPGLIRKEGCKQCTSCGWSACG